MQKRFCHCGLGMVQLGRAGTNASARLVDSQCTIPPPRRSIRILIYTCNIMTILQTCHALHFAKTILDRCPCCRSRYGLMHGHGFHPLTQQNRFLMHSGREGRLLGRGHRGWCRAGQQTWALGARPSQRSAKLSWVAKGPWVSAVNQLHKATSSGERSSKEFALPLADSHPPQPSTAT